MGAIKLIRTAQFIIRFDKSGPNMTDPDINHQLPVYTSRECICYVLILGIPSPPPGPNCCKIQLKDEEKGGWSINTPHTLLKARNIYGLMIYQKKRAWNLK